MPEPRPPPGDGRERSSREAGRLPPVAQMEKLEPQPQELEAFGFATLK